MYIIIQTLSGDIVRVVTCFGKTQMREYVNVLDSAETVVEVWEFPQTSGFGILVVL